MTQAARILVIDDDPASRGLMEQILAEDGHEITVAADGAEALRVLAEERSRGGDGFDAVVSDIRMVEADGLEVLDWVRQHAVETPVLALRRGTVTVSVKDGQGNVSRVERTFSVGAETAAARP